MSDEQFERLVALIKDADSVELKLTVPEEDQRSTVMALGMDPLDAQIRQVFFFDTPDLALDRHGVVVRARRVQRKGDDSVVKLRPVVPVGATGQGARSPTFGVEVDAMPGGFVCSGVAQAGAAADAPSRRCRGGTRRSASSSRRSSERSTRRTPRRESSSMTSQCSGRSSSSS